MIKYIEGISMIEYVEHDKEDKLHDFSVLVFLELNRAFNKHKGFPDEETGFLVITKELEELHDAIKLSSTPQRYSKILEELTETCAMCFQYALSCIPPSEIEKCIKKSIRNIISQKKSQECKEMK
jgi:hypothetical protein